MNSDTCSSTALSASMELSMEDELPDEELFSDDFAAEQVEDDDARTSDDATLVPFSPGSFSRIMSNYPSLLSPSSILYVALGDVSLIVAEYMYPNEFVGHYWKWNHLEKWYSFHENNDNQNPIDISTEPKSAIHHMASSSLSSLFACPINMVLSQNLDYIQWVVTKTDYYKYRGECIDTGIVISDNPTNYFIALGLAVQGGKHDILSGLLQMRGAIKLENTTDASTKYWASFKKVLYVLLRVSFRLLRTDCFTLLLNTLMSLSSLSLSLAPRNPDYFEISLNDFYYLWRNPEYLRIICTHFSSSNTITIISDNKDNNTPKLLPLPLKKELKGHRISRAMIGTCMLHGWLESAKLLSKMYRQQESKRMRDEFKWRKIEQEINKKQLLIEQQRFEEEQRQRQIEAVAAEERARQEEYRARILRRLQHGEAAQLVRRERRLLRAQQSDVLINDEDQEDGNYTDAFTRLYDGSANTSTSSTNTTTTPMIVDKGNVTDAPEEERRDYSTRFTVKFLQEMSRASPLCMDLLNRVMQRSYIVTSTSPQLFSLSPLFSPLSGEIPVSPSSSSST